MRRLLLLTVVLMLVAACSKKPETGISVLESSSPTPIGFPTTGDGKPEPLSSCLQPPDHSSVQPMADTPSLPGEVFWTEEGTQAGTKTTKVAVHTGLKELQLYVSKQWPKDGWAEQSGEAEPGIEFEGRFRKANTIVSVKARAEFCDKGWSQVTLSQAHL